MNPTPSKTPPEFDLSTLFSNIRDQFPALNRQIDGQSAVFLDGPAGSQTPQCVIDAISDYLAGMNANHGGLFATSFESDELLAESHRTLADFVGSDDPDTIAFGANMTTLTFSLSRALSKTWQSGDEILVSRLDHDANFTPWVLAARDAGATVRCIDIQAEDCTLDMRDFHNKLTDRTKLVAVGCASNATGSINPVAEITRAAHDVGAHVFLDAVHSAPHALIDVREWDCDYLACSAYKFFGPHIGILWGRRELLERFQPYKLRPADDRLPSRWMTGTQSHESIAGAAAAVNYLASLGRAVIARNAEAEIDCGKPENRRAELVAAYHAIGKFENCLAGRLLAGLQEIPEVKIWGITDENRLEQRLPTFSITHPKKTSAELATGLGRRGIFTWHGNFYALPLTEALDLEPDGMLRIGLLHYNTPQEIDRCLFAVREVIDE